MNGVTINIFADSSEQDYWREMLVDNRHLPVAWEIIPSDNMIRIQMNVAAIDFNFIDLEIIIFNNGDWQDIVVSNTHLDHVSIVASNKY